MVRCTATDLDWLARVLVGLPFAFRVRQPLDPIAALARVRDSIDCAISDSVSGNGREGAPVK